MATLTGQGKVLCLAVALGVALAAEALARPPALFPAGAERGRTTVISVSGSFKAWPVATWVEGDGVSVEPGGDKGTILVTVEPDAAAGLRWLRLIDGETSSSPIPLFIGVLPEVVETEPNDDPLKPQVLPGSVVVVNGRLAKRGDVDGFAVSLKRGQTLVASIEANRRLGSPMDAVLQIVSSEGFVRAQNDDDHGFDPQLVFEAPADGTYIVRAFAFPATPDSTIGFAGGDAFIYRLTLTTGGFADHAWPMAIGPETIAVDLCGWNIPEAARRVSVDDECDSEMVMISAPCLANSLELARVSMTSLREQEPSSRAEPQDIEIPAVITGRIGTRGDEDVFQFIAKKGEKIQIRAESRELGYPLDPLLRVLDHDGKVLTEQDDTGRNNRDTTLSFTAPGDGKFAVVIRDLNRQGGFRYVYRLTIGEPADFGVSLKVEQLTVRPGEPAKLAATIDRRNGFDQPVEVRAVGLPEGVTCEPATSDPKGDTAKTVTLVLSAKPGAESGAFRVVAASKGSPASQRTARAAVADLTETCPWLWVSVGPEAKK